MDQNSTTSTDEKTWKTILADHIGKAIATVIIAAGSTYLGIKFQSENKPNTNENPLHEISTNGTPLNRNLVTLKTATIIEAAKRISPRLTQLKIRSDNDGDVTIILENFEIDFTSLKIGKKINVAGELRAGGPRREPALFITKNNASSYLKIID